MLCSDLPTLPDFPGKLLSIPESRIWVVNSRTGALRTRCVSGQEGVIPWLLGWGLLGKKSAVRFLQLPLRAFPISQQHLRCMVLRATSTIYILERYVTMLVKINFRSISASRDRMRAYARIMKFTYNQKKNSKSCEPNLES